MGVYIKVVSTGERPYYKKYEALQIPPHGRLIDADALDFGKVFVGASDFAQYCRDGAQSVIDSAPTIIEEER